jgi:hypothetical protein
MALSASSRWNSAGVLVGSGGTPRGYHT